MPFETREYSNKNMSGNRIINVAPPQNPNDVEIHGHTHNIGELGGISQTEIGQPNGVAELNENGKLNPAQLPIVTEIVVLTSIEIDSKSVILTYNIVNSLPSEMYVISDENYRSPRLIEKIDYVVLENNKTISWNNKILDGILEEYDKLYIKYYSDSVV